MLMGYMLELCHQQLKLQNGLHEIFTRSKKN